MNEFRCTDCRYQDAACYDCRRINEMMKSTLIELCGQIDRGSGDLEISHSNNDMLLCTMLLKLAPWQSADERDAIIAAVNTFVVSGRWYS
jgi:hypothetical protein